MICGAPNLKTALQVFKYDIDFNSRNYTHMENESIITTLFLKMDMLNPHECINLHRLVSIMALIIDSGLLI